MKDLLKTGDLATSDVALLLATAGRFAEDPLAEAGFLAGQSVVIHMTKPSTRTRIASETAVAHLGGTPVFVRGDELQLGRGETVADTARVIAGYSAALIIRTFAQADVDELAAHAAIPVINALTDEDHPTQALADWITIGEHFGPDLSGRKFVYFGDGNNMAHAWLQMGAIIGVHVTVCTPEGQWAPDAAIVERCRQRALTTGATIEIEPDPIKAATGASVFYTDVWMSMGDPEDERARKEKALAPYAVTSELMTHGTPDAIFMHCLPAHRGEEVEADVMDGPSSLVWRQAFHRRTTIQAALFHLIRGDIKGTEAP